MLEVRELRANYGRIPILNGINLSVESGACLGILGHNGMGKTTFMRAVTGLLPIRSGEILFKGDTITSLPTHGRVLKGLGYVPQGRQIFPQLSVLDNLRMGALRTGEEAINSILEQMPRLKPLLNRPGGGLSGGEQQLLSIARALCGHPKLMLLDEPTEGIQPSIIDEIVELLTYLNRTMGLAIVVVEQNLEFIRALVSRVAVLQKGAIVREVSPQHLLDERFIGEFVGMHDPLSAGRMSR